MLRLVQGRCGQVYVLLASVVIRRGKILRLSGLQRRKLLLQLQDQIIVFSITGLQFLAESLQVLNVFSHGLTLI